MLKYTDMRQILTSLFLLLSFALLGQKNIHEEWTSALKIYVDSEGNETMPNGKTTQLHWIITLAVWKKILQQNIGQKTIHCPISSMHITL